MKSFLDDLNDRQKEAVEQTEGAILILAGAGTGKTKTITYRIANMIENKHISPFSILALTFTNKAGNEMKERVKGLIGEKAKKVTISTFHSFGYSLIRLYYPLLKLKENIVIYDTDDQKKVLEIINKKYNILLYIPLETKEIISVFSNIKEMEKDTDDISNFMYSTYLKELYNYYQLYLIEHNAIDFADILLYTKRLLENEIVLSKVQNRYKYIMVDEYQDTNNIQFQIVSMIADKYKNICVVGDENQSIYAFRGADIRNILSFREVYPNAVEIKLEQNYRSTKTIIKASNKVIENNKSKTDKMLWTANETGELIQVLENDTDKKEATNITKKIKELLKKGYEYKDITILYRINAQSRNFEDVFIREKIPYKVYGGLSFYQRMEIKDMVAFLRLFYNTSDNISLLRVINIPKRNVGETTKAKIEEFSEKNNLSMFKSLKYAKEIKLSGKLITELEKFYFLVKKYSEKFEEANDSLDNLLSNFLDEVGYFPFMANDVKYKENYDSRVENINEFLNLISEFELNSGDNDVLGSLLDEISLKQNSTNEEKEENSINLMTIHTSKGLEFPVVFLVGMVAGVFPSYRCESEEEYEEERRCYYVAITRAKKELFISYYISKKDKNGYKIVSPSYFIDELPNEHIRIIKE